MFKKEKVNGKEVDIKSLNTILNVGKKLINVIYVVFIISLLLLVTYVLKEWKILIS